MKDFVIKHGPVPPPRRWEPKPPQESPSAVIRAFAKMEPDDYIDIPIGDRDRMGVRANLYPQARRAGIKITYRWMQNGQGEFLRVWRRS